MLGVSAVLLLLLALSFALFYWNRDWVERKLFETLGELQKGAITVRDIHFAPLSQVPNIAIRLDSVTYFEHQAADRDPGERPILEVETVYIAFDLLDLLRGRINVSSLTIRGGSFYLCFYSNQSFNLFKAFGIGQVDAEPTAGGRVSSDMDLRLDNIQLINLRGRIEYQELPLAVHLHINRLAAGFRYREQVDAVRLRTELQLEQVNFRNRPFRPDKSVRLDLDFLLDEQTMLSRLRRGTFAVEGLHFDVTGSYLLRDAGWIDLQLRASDQELTLFSYLIEDKVINRNLDLLRQGNLYLNGTIRGPTFNRVPEIAFHFGAERLQLLIPGEEKKAIEELGFSGFFTTGRADDLSEALLRVDSLSARLPGGQVHGRFEVANLLDPFFRLHCHLQARIDGWDRLFKLGPLDSLSGAVSLQANMEGSLSGDERGRFSPRDSLRLQLDDVALHWPGYKQRFTGIYGTLRNREADLYVEALTGIYGSSRLKLRGRLRRALPRLLSNKALADADLWLRVDQLNTSEWPGLNTFLGLSAGERVSNLAIDFSLFPAKGIRKGHWLSGAVLQVRDAHADFQRLPAIRHLKGQLRFPHRRQDTLAIKVDELEADLKPGALQWRNGRLQITGETLQASGLLEFQKIALSEWMNIWEGKDRAARIHTYTTRRLSGRLPFSGRYRIGARRIDSLNVTDGDLRIRYRDTASLELEGLNVFVSRAVFQRQIRLPYLFSSLKGQVEINTLRSAMFGDITIRCQLEGRKNYYSVNASLLEGAGVVEEGLVVINLSKRLPHYRLRYHVAEFPAERLLPLSGQASRLRGPINITIDLSTSGRKTDEWMHYANGTLNIEGRNLQLSGLNLDDQSLQARLGRGVPLTGLGEFLLPGPFAAVLTGGPDFSEKLVMPFRPGQETQVEHMISSWRLADGVLESRDLGLVTPRYRFGGHGRIHLSADSLESLRIALVDKRGCALFTDQVSGPYSELHFRQSSTGLLPPDSVLEVRKLKEAPDCKPFYKGRLLHPFQNGKY